MERMTLDGNAAVAHVAYRVNDVCAIYPITPSSPMAELADEWSAEGRTNLWGAVPIVQEMQAEGGAAGAVHGSLQAGALTTTFTASQGLLLMLPNMFKIAGELTPCVFHVAARSVATQALSIFGDHSDVMAIRSTGFALLGAGSVQEAHDLALVAQAATLEARIPFVHFMDGFRTSHEINTVAMLSDEQIRAMIDDELVRAHRQRVLSPERPVTRGTAHNPDTFFQARETVNPFYLAAPAIVQLAMERFAKLTGRHYRLFCYDGHPEPERLVVVMGSAAETLRAAAARLTAHGERVGVLQVVLYRPWSAKDFLDALPASVRRVACSTARRSRVRLPSRSVLMSRRRWRILSRADSVRLCRWWSAADMAWGRRISPRPWQRPYSITSRPSSRAPASPSASTTTSAEPACGSKTISISSRPARPGRCSSVSVRTGR